MDSIDPLKAVPLQGLPVTEELSRVVKQKIKEAKMETMEHPADASDVSDLSPEAARLSRPQFEMFLEAAKEEILLMDRNSETFLPEATQRLVSSALEKKFGEKFTRDPAYHQMEVRMTQHILNDAESRSMIENFIDLIHMEAGQAE